MEQASRGNEKYGLFLPESPISAACVAHLLSFCQSNIFFGQSNSICGSVFKIVHTLSVRKRCVSQIYPVGLLENMLAQRRIKSVPQKS